MYHCQLHFYLLGVSCSTFETIKSMEPLADFTHTFMESETLEESFAAAADVVIALLPETDDVSFVKQILRCRRSDAQVLLLARPDQTAMTGDMLDEITDLWILPMSEKECRFRFLRWQQTYRMSKEFWQTSQFLEATIDHSPNLIWYKDKNGIHEKVNNSFCRTVNKTKEQVQGQRHAYIWDVEQDDPACIESELEVMKTRKTCVSEETIKAGEGTRLLTTYKSPLYDLDGSVMGTVGVAIDVTQERAYEQEIIKKNDVLETIFTSMDCGVLCHTVDGSRVLNVNRAALKILDYDSLEELVDTGFDMVAQSVLDEDKGMLRENIRKLTQVGDSVSVEYRVRHRNGDILHVMGDVKLLEENGELFYQRFLLDCTAQKVQEKKDKQHQMELVQAMSIDYSLVCFFDLNTGMGIPLRADEEDSQIFSGEISLRESMELYIQRFVYKDDQVMFREQVSAEHIEKELEEKNRFYVSYRACVGGEVKYFEMKVVRTGVWDENRSIVLGFRCVDEETRKEMEQKRLLEDALLQANRANRAKSVFLSNMSHDIRTPMNAIVGFTSLAISHIDQKSCVEEYLRKIIASGNHLLNLINDVLDMSRIESGKMRLEETPCSLRDILHGLYDILQADVQAKQLDLQMDTMDVLHEEIFCDKLRLNQVLLNLLSNAVKYTGAGGTVALRLKELPGAQEGCGLYEFCVKDTGIGISKEFLPHIFESFERELNTTQSGTQGTGLGMAITKNIVDMMNGEIVVTSEQNKGTQVSVTVSFRLSQKAEEQCKMEDLQGMRALVVDDDFDTCDSVSYMLAQIGMRAEWTLSGKEAVLRTRQAAMRGDLYQVYVIDWLMPDMNGLEVVRRIRREAGEDAVIILLTAYDWSDIREEALEAGVAAFCSKPLFLSDLKSSLRSAVHVEKERKGAIEDGAMKLCSGRILLVEDNELNQEIAATILEDAGFTTEIANNGKVAVEMLESAAPGYYQVVLMDIQMPVMDGYEATKAIRRLENRELASIPIFAMTANAFEDDRQAALNCGMNGHIAKPIQVEKLLEKIL